MKKYVVVIIVTISAICSFGQNLEKAWYYKQKQMYDSAMMIYNAAFPEIERKYGDSDTVVYAKELLNLASTYAEMREFTKSDSCYSKYLSIFDVLGVTKTSDYARVTGFRARVYAAIDKPDIADSLFQKSLNLYREVAGEKNLAYGKTLFYVGELYHNSSRIVEADSLFRLSCSIIRDVKGDTSLEYIKQLLLIGYTLNDFQRYVPAEDYFLKALALEEARPVADPNDYFGLLNNLGQLYVDVGKIEKGETYLLRAAEVSNKYRTETGFASVVILNNLASLYEKLNKWEKAEQMFQNALDEMRIIYGNNHPSISTLYNNLANFYSEMGNFQQAIPLFEKTLDFLLVRFGKEHKYTLTTIMNIAQNYMEIGNYELSKARFKEVIEISKSIQGGTNFQHANSLICLAMIYNDLNQPDSAIPLLEKSEEILRNIYGVKHQLYAHYLNHLAIAHEKKGEYDLAIQLTDKALDIVRNTYGEDNRNYIEILSKKAKVLWRIGHILEVGPLFYQSFEFYKRQNQKDCGFLSEKELTLFIKDLLRNLDIYQSYLYSCRTVKKQSDFAYDIELFRKGILLESVMAMKNGILLSQDSSLVNAFFRLRTLRSEIVRLVLTLPEKRDGDPEKLEILANKMEKDLRLKSKDYQLLKQKNNLSWKEIRDALRPGEAAVEFSSFNFYNGRNWTDSILYCAIVICPEDTLPQWVYLGEENSVKEILAGVNSQKGIDRYYLDEYSSTAGGIGNQAQAGNLYRFIWAPLESILQGKKTVYFSPSGLLNAISMAAIYTSQRCFMLDQYNLIQLSSTRSLVAPSGDRMITNAFIYGGIYYDTDTTALQQQAGKYGKVDNSLAYTTSVGNDTRAGFQFLPGTREEVLRVDSKLRAAKISTNLFTGITAIEESVKAISGPSSPGLLHLSTHGFYYPDTVTGPERKKLATASGSGTQFKYVEDPLFRSGLLMAGANLAWKGGKVPEGLEDGILTAKEVSNMDLRNTQLLVLSACQSGLGDVKGSEGVEGLQRGFKMAGVRYLIMSLWEVPDKETQEFMVAFYDYWLGGKPIREAFRATQLKMKNKYPREPYKWAGFVLTE